MRIQMEKMFMSAILLFFLSACALHNTPVQDLQSMKLPEGLCPGAQRIAVMPFKNSSKIENVETLVRSSFYNHLSSKAYTDIELFDVDAQIAALEGSLKKPWQQISPRDIGAFMNADFLICGEVLGLNKLFLGVYSQQALTLSVRMIETKSGQTLWSERYIERSHEWDLPLNPVSLAAAFFRCGLELRSGETVALIDKTCRSLVGRVPDPVLSPARDDRFLLQLASFQHRAEAERLMKRIRMEGLMPRLEPAAMAKKTWYRVMLGPYESDRAERVKHRMASEFKLLPVMIQYPAEPA